MALIITPIAKQEILEASRYIADFNPEAARRWRHMMLETCHSLGQIPGMGHRVEEAGTGLRVFSKEKYLIFFKAGERDVLILRVLDAARDWPKLVR